MESPVDAPSDPTLPASPARSRRAVPIVAAAAVAFVVALIQVRDGLIQLLDTVSYLSGAQAFRDGEPFTSTLAPSFSNFTMIEFLERDGRLPFVDFPVGYSTLAGLLGYVVGARRALGIIVVVATVALAAAIAIGPDHGRHGATRWFRAAFGALVVGLPVYRLAVQGVLSEPLFCAVLVGYVAALIRYRRSGERFGLACVLGASLGLLRFLGGGLALLIAVEHFRRHRKWRPAALTAVACLTPVGLNVVWAGAAGGGHTNHWHGVDGSDLRLVARSIAGLFDAETGDLARTLLGVGDQVPWWGYPVAVVWVLGVGAAIVQFLGLLKRPIMPAAMELAFTAAGLLTLGLFGGIAMFDALATPDNRIMFPAGLISLCGVVWSVELTTRRWRGAAAAGLALWSVAAVRPWNVTDLFDSPDRLAEADEFAELDAAVVITNEADRFALRTGLPAAYLPPPRMSLTDEPVDRAALFEQLPCALAGHDGVVVVFANAFFGVGDLAVFVDPLVADGRLIPEVFEAATIYRPGPDLSC